MHRVRGVRPIDLPTGTPAPRPGGERPPPHRPHSHRVCEAATKGRPALALPEGCEGSADLEYDTTRCVGCWGCLEACPEGALERVAVCPVVVPNEADQGLGWRHAIYLPNPYAVPLTYVRDPDRFSNSVNVVVDDQGLEVTLV